MGAKHIFRLTAFAIAISAYSSSCTAFQLSQISKQSSFVNTCKNENLPQVASNSRRLASITSMRMAVTPIGPFCPFRSSAAQALDPSMSRLTRDTPDFATEMARLQAQMMAGETPEPSKVLVVAENIEMAVDEWDTLMARLSLSQDFQTREYAKLTQAHLEQFGQNLSSLQSMMRWQAGCLRALAQSRPPPPPPNNVDLQKIMEQVQQAERGVGPPSMTMMMQTSQITSTPFNAKAFEKSSLVQEEYMALCKDHNSLIQMGGDYAKFDALGKMAFIDQIEAIEDRWDIFFARSSLMGELNSQFIKQTNAFLGSMNMDESKFRSLLRRAHEIMREEADTERNQIYF